MSVGDGGEDQRDGADPVVDPPTPSRLSALVDNSAAIISLKDPFGRYQFVNRAFADLLGVDAEAVIGTSDFDHWPDAAPTLRGNDQRVLTGRDAAQFEEVVTLADGPRTWLAQKFPILDPDGVPTAVGSVANRHHRAHSGHRHPRRTRTCALHGHRRLPRRDHHRRARRHHP